MCLEAFCCPGLAASASGMVIRERYRLGLDKDDVRLIRCSNCLQFLSCFCWILAMVTDSDAIDSAAAITDCVADVVFCCVAGCMYVSTVGWLVVDSSMRLLWFCGGGYSR
jgi:hypothetical protein